MTTQQAATFGARFTAFKSRDAQVSPEAPRSDRILDAARRCYVTIGWDKTTMEDVGRIAGMSRATLYKNFPTSDVLRDALRARALDLMRLDCQDAVDMGETLSDSLGNIAAALSVWCSTMRSVESPNALYFRVHAGDSSVIIDLLSEVLKPRLALAQQNREMDPGRDLDRAVEWVARCLTGFALLPTGRDYDSDDPLVAREFIREFLASAL